MKPNIIIDNFFEFEDQLHKLFKYKEDWRKIPIVDQRAYYWHLSEEADGSGYVIFFDTPLTEEVINSGGYYEHTIYTQRFLPKWVYRTKHFTMICEDTHTDGNQWLGIYDNAKEQKDLPASLPGHNF